MRRDRIADVFIKGIIDSFTKIDRDSFSVMEGAFLELSHCAIFWAVAEQSYSNLERYQPQFS